MKCASQHALSSRELSEAIKLLQSASTREQTQFVLEKPREAIRQSQDSYVHQWDPRLSTAGNRIARRLGMLLDATMNEAESEGDYNTRAGAAKGWLVMDKKNFHLPRSRDKIEICDLFTQHRELICVKKMSSSSALSHLFSQGSVSATLLRTMTPYRQKLETLAQAEWSGLSLAEADIPAATVVYAVATSKDGPLHETMFFFSQVNLLSHVRTVRQFCKVALCKISVDDALVALRPVAKKGKSRRAKKPSSKVTQCFCLLTMAIGEIKWRTAKRYVMQRRASM